jgi:site-specific DNA recombinase
MSQKHEGWQVLEAQYDDGGFSGGSMERPGLRKLLEDISAGKIDTVVVYKVDRLTRSLADFAKIVESFDSKSVSFVSVTQQFNTTTSMGRLTLNILLSFAQFEREVTGERIRDKVAASKKKGMWMGGHIPLGYDLAERMLIINPKEAEMVRTIFLGYLKWRCVRQLHENLKSSGVRSKRWISSTGRQFGGVVISRGSLYHLLNNPIYIGKTGHKGVLHNGQHQAIVDQEVWDQVVTLLKENRVARRTAHNLPSGRLLRGKLVCSGGQTYTPTHASKKGRRYFYYTLVGRAKTTSANSIKRLPAEELETRVVTAVSAFLDDSLRLAARFSALNVREMRLLTSAAKHRSAVLSDLSSKEGHDFIQQIVTSVVVLPNELQIRLCADALGKSLLGKTKTSTMSEQIELCEPLLIARRGSEVRLILSNGEHKSNEPIPSLVRAVVQARTWSEWIAAGTVRTLDELAQKTGLNKRYAARILRLAALSPDLYDAIIRGDHSPLLTVVGVTKNLPLDWERQRLLT